MELCSGDQRSILSSSGTGVKWPKLSQWPVGKLSRGESGYLGMAEIELDRKTLLKKAS